MKLTIPATFFCLTGIAAALTPVTERFSKATLNISRWYAYHTGVGNLVPANKKLNFVTGARPGDYENNFASLELLSTRPKFNEDWQLTLDLANTSGLGEEAACGFMIANPADRRDYLFVHFHGRAGIAGGFFVNGVMPDDGRFGADSPVNRGSIRVRFNKDSKLLHFYVSVTGSGPDAEWAKIGSFSPTGKGGTVRGNWKMKGADAAFVIQLFGFSAAGKVKTGEITIDNVRVTEP